MKTISTYITVVIVCLSFCRTEAQSQTAYSWTTLTEAGTNGAVRLSWPTGIVVDQSGVLYVVDNRTYTIRKLTPVGPNWTVSTIAGLSGSQGSADGTNSDIRFGFRQDLCAGIAMDASGSLYVTDSANNTIRKLTQIDADWVSTTIGGLVGNHSYADGTNSDARFANPLGVTVDSRANVYVADCENLAIRKITSIGTNWVTTTLARGDGYADGTNTTIRTRLPRGIVTDTNDAIYFTDSSLTIRKLTAFGTDWVCSTIAGKDYQFGTQDGTNSTIRFGFGAAPPQALTVDRAGNLFVADWWNHTIRMLRPIGTNWVSSTIGGLGLNLGNTDGIGSGARFAFPQGIAADANGLVYVADTQNGTIRMGRPIPSLRASLVSSGHLVFSWPSSFSNFVLETSTTLNNGAMWTTLSNGLSIIDGNFIVTNGVDVPPVFFRLRQQ